ncbi:XrtN system VIT domain-containing protein [Flavobacterium sp. SOK18b]|uniref:XrtN system VIT domain-containing protein n=1 Tax=Flavobacterium sp. SOK18b TaxID=797900 RepID=UPI0015FA4F59|nr:XrtN system VIT domain-containing protein [Flavobacterium sp. SOK18b]MBB1193326.1 XrtN system VIT domain-containing protein [Flavobacterium sp. SOK18b]
MKIETKVNDFTKKIGVKVSIVVTLLSFILLISSLVGSEFDFENFEAFCFCNIIIELLYSVIVIFKVLKDKAKHQHLIPFLFVNWFIGCFSTNVFINIFENLPIWVYVVTFLFCLSNFAIYSNFKHKYLNTALYFSNGCSYLLILYYAIYLIPFAPISIMGILALGLGFYGLVPMIVLICHTVILIHKFQENRKNGFAFGIGSGIVCIGFAIFAVGLNRESQKISKNTVATSFEKINTDLPQYITISQNLKPNFFNEILLKKDIVYIASDNFFHFRGFNSFGNNKQFNERKTHDPIINLAYLFTSRLYLSADDRINILKSNFDKRLETEEQLWDGKDLFTKNIKEDVKIYANDRLAYTEITMDIACSEKTWGDKEAIYSFQLPEGAVATSLSLWVNGIERKGVLTTKEKAKKAYNQIVGVEYRDPSLMQWREGNKVVVRVFPIRYDLPRTFKCGFTTPLKVENNTMKYVSLDIKGPNTNGAKTISRIQMVGNEKFEASKYFELENGFYINESTGIDAWEAEVPITNKVFSTAFIWKNKAYKINEIQKQKIAFKPSEIILDLNSSWTKSEIEKIVNLSNGNYFVWNNNQKQLVNRSNYETVFFQFEDLTYSLLPLYNLKENSLVITKSGTISANFEELETSDYLKKLKATTHLKNIKVINISDNLNPFWQTVKEQKMVSYLKADLNNSLKLIQQNQFLEFKTLENTINVEPANISIQETELDSKIQNNGSNHIYRMYAFGKVLQEQVTMQNDSLKENKFVGLAKDANIVTPISSLIVLETDEDYKKNGIEKNVNTLGNASINNDGAVPEPHEWLLIIIGLTTLFFYYRKQKRLN